MSSYFIAFLILWGIDQANDDKLNDFIVAIPAIMLVVDIILRFIIRKLDKKIEIAEEELEYQQRRKRFIQKRKKVVERQKENFKAHK